jgi:transcriptional regulator with XRE-family HTH domain
MLENVVRKVGHRIRELRQKKGWSQEKLAEEAGLHRTYIGQVERGVPLTVGPFPGIILLWHCPW